MQRKGSRTNVNNEHCRLISTYITTFTLVNSSAIFYHQMQLSVTGVPSTILFCDFQVCSRYLSIIKTNISMNSIHLQNVHCSITVVLIDV